MHSLLVYSLTKHVSLYHLLPEMNKLWLFIAIDIVLFFFKRRHLGQRNVEHFTLPSQHSLLITGNWSRNGCRELSFTPGHYYVMTL